MARRLPEAVLLGNASTLLRKLRRFLEFPMDESVLRLFVEAMFPRAYQ